jgi:cytoskeletal protein CcmA (bactofilin family)
MKPAEGTTAIGKSITIRGDISGHEELYMDGDFEGTIKLPDSRLTIGPNARVKADLDAGDVVIYGKVDGNIRAAGRLELRDSAALTGDILAQRLSIEENARVKGKVELTEGALGKASQPAASTSTAAPNAH